MRLLAAVLFVSSVVVSPVLADASETLRRFEAFYNGLSEGAAAYTSELAIASAGINNQAKQEVRFARPNRVVIRTTDGSGGGAIRSDGNELYLAIPKLKRYTLEPAPESFAEWISGERTRRRAMPAPGGDIVLQLLGGEPLKTLVAGPEAVRPGRSEQIAGHDCDVFEIEATGRKVTLWIESGETPWLRRFQSESGDDDARIRIRLTFDDWQQSLPADHSFAIEPGEEMQKVDTLFPQSAERRPVSGPQRRRTPRSGGGKASAFEADLLGGGAVNLADHLGKDVIVLDFWATWCKPCLMGLPVLASETAARKERGVVFYAVNVAEQPEKVTKLMQQKDWNFPVVLDANAKISKSYGVGPIPHTVIIGRDGNVAHVHVGFSTDLKSRLSAELDALLGK